jgi:hypothetical protein
MREAHDGRDGDELEPLRRAWEELRAPEPAPERSPADAAEHAALEWVRAAWERVAPPAPARLSARGPMPRPVPAPERRWAWIAAAAAAGIAGLWLALAPTGEGPRGTPSAPEPGIARREPPPSPLESGEGPSAVLEEQPTAPGKVEVAHVTSDRMELRSGSVRLILLTGSTGPAAARSEDG